MHYLLGFEGHELEPSQRFFDSCVEGVEAWELDWSDDWGSMESMMVDKPEASAAIKPGRSDKDSRKKVLPQKQKETRKDDVKIRCTWFCHDFNTQGGVFWLLLTKCMMLLVWNVRPSTSAADV